MFAMLFLSLTDFKTIEIPQSSGGGSDAALLSFGLGVGVIVLLFVLMYFLHMLWSLFLAPNRAEPKQKRRRRKGSPSASPRRGPPKPAILIDGSNVMYWNDNKPSLAPLIAVIREADALGLAPNVVFDASAGWRLFGKYLHDRDFSRILGLRVDQVLVVPKGTQADPFLLETAQEFGARIVTNDRYRDWADRFPQVARPGALIRGGMRDGQLWLNGLEPAGKAEAVNPA
jgi:Zc3h12a-like Ribonuclease NYN domain